MIELDWYHLYYFLHLTSYKTCIIMVITIIIYSLILLFF
jgi:hypothetical protein